MRVRAVIFDLDGTLLDSLADIGESMNFVLEDQGLEPHPLWAYRDFVGDGIACLARRALPEHRRDDATVARSVSRMREVYASRMDGMTRPYDGIPELLDALELRGIPKAVLSNKPHDLTLALVRSLLGRWSFDPVFGQRTGVARKPDPAAALEIATHFGIEPAGILYVGDTPIDMATALAAGMQAAGAAWGFRSEEELRRAGAGTIVRVPADVLASIANTATSAHIE